MEELIENLRREADLHEKWYPSDRKFIEMLRKAADELEPLIACPVSKDGHTIIPLITKLYHHSEMWEGVPFSMTVDCTNFEWVNRGPNTYTPYIKTSECYADLEGFLNSLESTKE